MDTRRERFDPGVAPVYPLPQRDPMRALADWGAPPSPPIRPDESGRYERPWISPGPPPWAEEEPASIIPAWTLVAVLVGSALVCVAGGVGLAAWLS
jgi:hypothetical protein